MEMKTLYKRGEKLKWAIEMDGKTYFLNPTSSDGCYDCDLRHNDELCNKMKLCRICPVYYGNVTAVSIKDISYLNDGLFELCNECGESMMMKIESKGNKVRAYLKCKECGSRSRNSNWFEKKDEVYAKAEAFAIYADSDLFDAVASDDIFVVTEKDVLKKCDNLEEKFSKVFDARNYSSGDGFDNNMPDRAVVEYFIHDGFDVILTNNILDEKMKEICPKGKYRCIGSLEEDLMTFKPNDSSLMGYMDKNGKEIIPAMYRHCWDFKNGIAQVEADVSGYEWFFINKKNENLGKDRLIAEASVLNEEYDK